MHCRRGLLVTSAACALGACWIACTAFEPSTAEDAGSGGDAGAEGGGTEAAAGDASTPDASPDGAPCKANPITTIDEGWVVTHDAKRAGTTLIITPEQPNKIGAAWWGEPHTFDRFVASFTFRISVPDAGARPADGIAFVWKTGTAPGGVGMSGGNMGACSLEGQAVAVDTFELSTPGETRLKLLDTGDTAVCPNNPIATDNTVPNIADGLPHNIEIDVNGQDVRVTLDGKPRLIGVWPGRPVFSGFFGFTASTGASASEHSVTDVQLSFPNEPQCP